NRLLHPPPPCSAGHGDPGEYERWVTRNITSEFVTWVKNGEAGLNTYVDHGRAGGDGRGETPATASAMTTQADKVLFRTRRGLHLQYKPEPSIDQWINSEVQFDREEGGYIKPTGKVLNATEQGTFAQYQRRHVVRCRAGDLADKLTRMVDKCLPRVANESRVYIMRFPETIPKLLKRVRKIRKRIKATRQGDAKMAVQTSRKRTRQRHETRGGTTKSSVPKPRGIKTKQHVTKEHDDEQESIPDWGDDVANDVMDNAEDTPTATTAAHVAEGDDVAAMWGAHSSKLCKWSKRIWRNNVASGDDFDKN
ncbi:unnamed protein product, partial [Symbiodinium sp. KB8]